MSYSNPLLSIGIPSYNRPGEILKRASELLGEEMQDRVEVVILDNHSDIPIEKTLSEALGALPPHFRILRNPVNVGAGANICRCFEQASGKWLWLLGDDDHVLPGAVKRILAEVEKWDHAPEVAGLSCSSGIFTNPVDAGYNSLDSWMTSLRVPEKFGNAMFISACVFRLEHAHKYLRAAYQFNTTHSPHFVISMCCARDGLAWRDATIASVGFEYAPPEQRWSWPVIISGLTTLADVPGCRNAVKAHLKNGLSWLLPRPYWKICAKMCLYDESMTPAQWMLFLSKVGPFLTPLFRLCSLVTFLFLGVLRIFPWLRKILQVIAPSDNELNKNLSIGESRI